MGADRGQFQAAARGQQPVPGQPRGPERRPERGGVRPGTVPAVEVLAQPAAVGSRPRPPAPSGPTTSPTLLILFLKLSEKLYTSVFHHGLKVGGPRRGAGGTGAARRGSSPTPTPGPAVPARPAPRGWMRSPTPAGGRTRREGAAAAAQRAELSSLHLDPPTARPVSIPVTVTVTVTAFAPPRPPNCLPGADPLPRGVPALFGYELCCGGTLHTDMYEERMYGQFLWFL